MCTEEEGYPDIVKKLLLLGADIKITTNFKLTALFCACYKGHVGIFKILAPLAPGGQFNISVWRTVRGGAVKILLGSSNSNYLEILEVIDGERH